MSKELFMELYFKPIDCPKCGEKADPITGEFFAGEEVYKVHYFCNHCSNGFSRQYGNVKEGYSYGD